MPATNDDVTIIIPSSCLKERAQLIKSALQSLLDQDGGSPKIIFIANGPNVDPEIFEEVSSLSPVTAFQSKIASAPLAVLRAVEKYVCTPYFGFLDDDDFYFKDAIKNRLGFMEANSDIDVVVGRAEVEIEETGHRHLLANLENMKPCRKDPFAVIYQKGINWMTSSAGLYRRSIVKKTYFENPTPYFEWTYLATKLILGGVDIAFLESSDHLITQSSSRQSLSQTESYRESEELFLNAVLNLNLSKKQRLMVEEHLCDFYHERSDVLRKAGKDKDAFYMHLKSMKTKRGFVRYILGTRKFLV
jgi:hypothetical protein